MNNKLNIQNGKILLNIYPGHHSTKVTCALPPSQEMSVLQSYAISIAIVCSMDIPFSVDSMYLKIVTSHLNNFDGATSLMESPSEIASKLHTFG